MTDLTITATARDWTVLRQTHLAAVQSLKEHGHLGPAFAGALLGAGFTRAVIETARPPVSSLKDGQDDDKPVTVVLNKHLFSGVFNSLDLAHQMNEDPNDVDPLPENIKALIEHAWLLFKTEAILAEVG